MEKLASYLKANAITQEQFAGMVDLTQGTLSKLCSGASQPSLDVALKIEAATGGNIAVEDWAAFAALASRNATASGQAAQ